jgi:cellulose synthase/poly-beta-1,6-N-acetylglucosamine synthase-like glycosyltransferase
LGVALLTTAYRAYAFNEALELLFWGSVAMLAYVYVGYPVLLAAMSAVARAPIQRGVCEPSVCLFIAANDEGSVIDAKLRNALEIDYPSDKLQIVVASDGSLDQTNAIASRFAPRVKLLEFTPRRGKTAAINDGMSAVDSDIVVFSDANTFLAPDAIRALVRNFADEQVGAVSGDVMLIGERADLARSEDLYYRYERWLQQAESEIGSMIGADGALYAVRRSLFVPPPRDTILDDMAIPMAVVRARRRVVFEPSALAIEQGSETAIEEFARKSRVIAGAIQFMSRHDSSVPIESPQVILSLLSHKVLRWLSPAFAATAGIAAAALGVTSPGHAAFAAAQAALLAVGALGCFPQLRRNSVIAFVHYFCLVQFAAVVGFVRGIARRQSVLWQRFDHETRTGGTQSKVSVSQFGAGSGL